ncbi:MAG: MarR family winged helix-turn-helix transcriptional regulator [Planctomycetaceae bacterium]
MVATARKDSIDRFLERALDLFPMLDREVEAAVDRMEKLTKKIDRTTEQTVGRFGLNTGEFRLLLKLRQTPGERAAAGRLASSLSLSAGAMTNRIDGLEEAGFVTRERDPEDRRSVVVALTQAGREVLAKAVDAQADEERRILGALTPEEQQQLNALLRTVLLAIEGDDPDVC